VAAAIWRHENAAAKISSAWRKHPLAAESSATRNGLRLAGVKRRHHQLKCIDLSPDRLAIGVAILA